jgi:hypothetical protein
MDFSSGKSGENRMTNVQEGSHAGIAIYDPDENLDCDVRDKIWTDAKIMDPKTGAYILRPREAVREALARRTPPFEPSRVSLDATPVPPRFERIRDMGTQHVAGRRGRRCERSRVAEGRQESHRRGRSRRHGDRRFRCGIAAAEIPRATRPSEWGHSLVNAMQIGIDASKW